MSGNTNRYLSNVLKLFQIDDYYSITEIDCVAVTIYREKTEIVFFSSEY